MQLIYSFNKCKTSGKKMRPLNSIFRHCEDCPGNNVNCPYKRCARCLCPVVLSYDNNETCEGCKDDHTISSDRCCICDHPVNLTKNIKVIVPNLTKPTEFIIGSMATPNGNAHFTCYYSIIELDEETNDLDLLRQYNRFTPFSKKFDVSRYQG